MESGTQSTWDFALRRNTIRIRRTTRTFHPRFFVPVKSDHPQRYFSSGPLPEEYADGSKNNTVIDSTVFAYGSRNPGDRIMLTRRKLLGNTMKISGGLALGRNAVSFADATPSFTLK